jgi:hypothetical protein
MAETIHSEPSFSLEPDDDLPRTIRRERDAKAAREREARERDARERLSMASTPVHAFERQVPYGDRHTPFGFAAPAASIAALDVPFSKLMAFFLKAVFAAIPALIMLAAMLWLAGRGLQTFFPDLVKLKILIYMPK